MDPQRTITEIQERISIVHCTMLDKMERQMRKDLHSDYTPIIITFREGDFMHGEQKR